MLQSPYFFRLPCPPPPLPMGILYSPQFCMRQDTKMAAHWTLRSHGKIGDCEQSMIKLALIKSDSLEITLDARIFFKFFVVVPDNVVI